MEQTPLISVIVPVYNVSAWLPRCVDSILAQTYKNLEILLVDDGSTDDSGRICEEYAKKDTRIRVLHKKNGGLSSARNAGLDVAAGQYIGFVDSDDWIEPEMYAVMLALMEQYDAQIVCAGRCDVDEATGDKTLGLCPEREEQTDGETLTGRIFLWDHCDSSACDKLYRRELFEGIRYPEGKTSEDIPVTYRLALKAQRAILCEKPFYNYFHRSGSISKGAGITEKTFHYSQHTAVILEDIRKNHPKIAPQAEFLRVHSLYHILLRLDHASSDIRRAYDGEYRFARRELARHWKFILTCPWLTRQQRVTDILLILNLYHLLRPVFHRA
ncbi:MAG: glycosyltransferase [Eubacteriales bacterium]|nr:glycosyltransferase [Eubacteriales bacterium]